MTRGLAALITLAGASLVVAGAAMIYLPVGLVTAGGLLTAVGLFGIDDGRPRA